MADEVDVIRDVFGLEPTSKLLATITGLSESSLHRLSRGEALEPRAHVATVAEFAREVRDVLFEDPTWSPERRAAMRRWLEDGRIDFDGSRYAPCQILASQELTNRALAELQVDRR
jgi:hypothetical protein